MEGLDSLGNDYMSYLNPLARRVRDVVAVLREIAAWESPAEAGWYSMRDIARSALALLDKPEEVR